MHFMQLFVQNMEKARRLTVPISEGVFFVHGASIYTYKCISLAYAFAYGHSLNKVWQVQKVLPMCYSIYSVMLHLYPYNR